MEARENSFLEEFGPGLIDQGYNIIPIKQGYKWPKGLNAWEEIEAKPEDVTKWAKRFQGVGVLTKHNPAVDLDIRDIDFVNEMISYVEELLGETVQRIGEAPKSLLVYRTDKPFPKLTSKTYVDLLGREHKVEILADGQQFVAFATHPDTQKPYSWTDNIDLTDWHSDDLPTITEEHANQIIDHFENKVPKSWTVKGSGKTGLSGPTLVKDDHNVLVNLKPRLDINLDALKQALREIDAEEYDDWYKVGMALYHQFDGGERGYRLWNAWSKQSEKYESKGMRQKWDTFGSDLRKEPITAASILKMAKDRVNRRYETLEPSGKKSSSFVFTAGENILTKLAPPDWLIENVVEKDSTGLIFGDPASYKSFISIDMACHVAAGKEWNGNKVNGGPVMYIAGEGHNGFARRLAAWEAGNSDVKIADIPIYFSLRAADLNDKDDMFKVCDAIDELIETHDTPPALIVVDTLARNFGGSDENSTSEMNSFVNNVNDFLRDRYKCVVMIVHHTGKGDKKSARGSSALKGAVDFEYRIERPEGSELVCEMTNTKTKDAPEHAPIFFQGEEKIIDGFDQPITSLVFKQTDAPDKTPASEILKGNQSALFNFIKSETETDGFIESKDLRTRAVDCGVCRDSKQFHNALSELRKKGLICTKDNEISILEDVL